MPFILMTYKTFKVIEFLRQLGVAFCSRTTLYSIQCTYVNSIIYAYWTRMQVTFVRQRSIIRIYIRRGWKCEF
jgi:hypothetical protein